MLGTVRVPVFWTRRSNVVGLAIDWRAGKLAASTCTGNSPFASCASWRAAPQPAASAAAPSASTTPETLLPLTIAPRYQRQKGSVSASRPLRRPRSWADRRRRCAHARAGKRAPHRVEFLLAERDPRRGRLLDGSQRRRTRVYRGSARPRGIRGHDDPHRPHDLVGAAPAVPVRRRARLAVPVRAAVVLVPAARVDRRPL